MANDEHVALLRQGVEAWNAWRWAYLDFIQNFEPYERANSPTLDPSRNLQQLEHYLSLKRNASIIHTIIGYRHVRSDNRHLEDSPWEIQKLS